MGASLWVRRRAPYPRLEEVGIEPGSQRARPDPWSIVTMGHQDSVPPALDVLFCALRAPAHQAVLAARASKLSPDEWRLLTDLAIDHHRVGPRVWSALKSAVPDEVPPDLAERFEANAREVAIHAVASKAETARVVRAFNEAAIEPCLLKGWALEEDLFGQVGMRVMRDLDILIDAQDLLTACEKLQQCGYYCDLEMRFRSRDALESLMHFAHHIVFIRPTSQTMIELHTRLFRNERLLPVNILKTEQRALRAYGGTVGYRVPTLASNFIYLALHGYVSRWERAKWLVDIPPLLCRLSSSDWQWILEQSHRLGIERTLGIALVLARDFLKAVIPAPAQSLLDRAEGSYLAAACRRELLVTEPYANRPTLGRWLESHIINLSSSARMAVVGASLRSLIVRESDVLPSHLASRFQVLHYLSAASHVPQRIGRRLLRRIF